MSPARIAEKFDISALPQEVLVQLNNDVTTHYRLNSAVETPAFPGLPHGEDEMHSDSR